MRHLARFRQDSVLSLVTGFRISHFLLTNSLLVRPHCLDVSNDGHDIRFRDLISKCWHWVKIRRVGETDATFKNIPNQQLITMMPCMPCLIMRWSAETTRCIWF